MAQRFKEDKESGKEMTDSEINELVAKKLGWTHEPSENINMGRLGIDQTWRRGDKVLRYSHGMLFKYRLNYSGDIALAWEIVATFDGFVLTYGCDRVDPLLIGWECVVNNKVAAKGDTAPKAICLSLLKA